MSSPFLQFRQSLGDIGFIRRHANGYYRELPASRQSIVFGSHSCSHASRCFSCSVGVYHEPIHAILGREDKPYAVTFMMPIHLLTPEHRWFDWPLLSPLTDEIISDVLEHIHRYAEPYLESTLSIEQVKQAVESEQWQQYFCIDSNQRLLLRCATIVALGQPDLALDILESELADQVGRIEKHRLSIVNAIQRIKERPNRSFNPDWLDKAAPAG